jgi:hypothetical protein
MDKAGPTKARPAANIGMPAAENPGKCSHSKRRVIRRRYSSAGRTQRLNGQDPRKMQEEQMDRWLSDVKENHSDLSQIDCKTVRFEFA